MPSTAATAGATGVDSSSSPPSRPRASTHRRRQLCRKRTRRSRAKATATEARAKHPRMASLADPEAPRANARTRHAASAIPKTVTLTRPPPERLGVKSRFPSFAFEKIRPSPRSARRRSRRDRNQIRDTPWDRPRCRRREPRNGRGLRSSARYSRLPRSSVPARRTGRLRRRCSNCGRTRWRSPRRAG